MLARLLTRATRPTPLRRLFAQAPNAEIVSKETRSADGTPIKFQYIDNELKPVNHLVLRTRQSIEEYVFKTIRDYFRTTHGNGLTLNSDLHEHGLDSLDLVEIAMTIEADLGYQIASENLPAFTRPAHYINFIEQVENFKEVYGKAPLS